jgi:hypothetical protein
MPQYFFDATDGCSFPDPVEVELSDVEEACRQALIIVSEILHDRSMKDWDGIDWEITVKDTFGWCVFRVRFRRRSRCPSAASS